MNDEEIQQNEKENERQFELEVAHLVTITAGMLAGGGSTGRNPKEIAADAKELLEEIYQAVAGV